jgi:hypothetical protein
MSQAICALVQQGYSVSACCQAFGLPKAKYYRLRQEPKAKTDPLRQQVQQVALDWPCCFGLALLLWTGLAMATAASLTNYGVKGRASTTSAFFA